MQDLGQQEAFESNPGLFHPGTDNPAFSCIALVLHAESALCFACCLCGFHLVHMPATCPAY